MRWTIIPLVVASVAAYAPLSDETIASFPVASLSDFDIHNQQGILAPILIPRVPGTEGSAKVRQHFARFFEQNLPLWNLQWQNSTSKTPLSLTEEVPFINLIATRDPPWVKNTGDVGRLALVAHYDSLGTPQGFIGAIDSAAPCAMILHAAKSIDEALTKKWEKMQADGDTLDDHKGIQVLLLDGEEAFLRWTEADSVYGARALAEEWEAIIHPARSTYRNPLESIELFVLLDLLGSQHQPVPSSFKTTHWAYKNWANVETKLRTAGRMKTGTTDVFLNEAQKSDRGYWAGGSIGDDHGPFMARGVEILHMIAYGPGGFPPVWHKAIDDGEHLHMDTVLDWATMTAAFAAEWMELDGFFGSSQPSANKISKDRSEL